ncbi:MAG: ribonuclease III [Oscillospiraceae bacterium]|nr:ribonuclease III [Oscillospiraceae bacterium]
MTQLEEVIGYAFRDPLLYEIALTHSSYYNENRGASPGYNERLEFLGDSVLGFLTADHLFHTYRKKTEGELTRMRAALVCESSLAEAAREIGLHAAVKLGRGEEMGGGRNRPSLLADAMEALLAAVFLDGGMSAARTLAEKFLLNEKDYLPTDYKTTLQELLQREPARQYAYRLADASGPDHAKVFTVEILIEGELAGSGSGASKKEAEQAAACMALEWLEERG